MSQCRKCSRFPEPGGAGANEKLDRISTLPDELLGYMLSFLPTKCAVSTSVLSSRWRYIHLLTNCLSFDATKTYDENHDGFEEDDKDDKKYFKRFVNRVLLFHKVSPIKSFHLTCGEYIYDDSHLRNWINVAIRKGVEQLHLRFRVKSNPLPLCLFTSHTVVELKIHVSISHFQVPDSVHLPSLKILDLKEIRFSNSHSFGVLLSACPLLQELRIVSCRWSPLPGCHVRFSLRELKLLTIKSCDGQFEVDAPKLIDLELHCPHPHLRLVLSLKNADSLVKAHLSFSYMNESANDFSSFKQHNVALIKAVHHAKELYVLGYSMKYLTLSDEDHMPSYPNLLKLTLGRCSYAAWKYVAHWLGHSPRLQTLNFEQGLVKDGPRLRDEELPPTVALAPFSSRLKVVNVSDFRGFAAELALVKYLLENAGLLKRLVLRQLTYEMTRKQERQSNRKLLMFPRASKTCVVQVKGYRRDDDF